MSLFQRPDVHQLVRLVRRELPRAEDHARLHVAEVADADPAAPVRLDRERRLEQEVLRALREVPTFCLTFILIFGY